LLFGLAWQKVSFWIDPRLFVLINFLHLYFEGHLLTLEETILMDL